MVGPHRKGGSLFQALLMFIFPLNREVENSERIAIARQKKTCFEIGTIQGEKV
jgi:hypothetical protein